MFCSYANSTRKCKNTFFFVKVLLRCKKNNFFPFVKNYPLILNDVKFAKFQHAKTKAYCYAFYVYLPKHPTHEGFQQGFDDVKIANVLVSANFLTIFLCFTNKKTYLCTHHT